MRILLVSDEESKYIWDFFDKERFRGVELIISCGDLDARYLTFLATMIPAPLVYVHGNHDKKYRIHAPEGCTCIDDTVFEYKGVRLLGMGGAPGRRGPEEQEYTEYEMTKRLKRVSRKVHKAGGVDILVTHAPALGLGDLDDPYHRGFGCFREFIDTEKPKYHFYGHVHLRYGACGKPIEYGETTLLNACGYKLLDIDVGERPPRRRPLRMPGQRLAPPPGLLMPHPSRKSER